MRAVGQSVRSSEPASQSLHMVRADLSVRAFHRWAGSRGLISRSAFDEGFAMHCLLVESFGDLAPKPFRVIIPRDNRHLPGVVYGYCQATADALRQAAAAYADPLQAKVLPASGIDSKAMPRVWESGRRFGFEVLIRPIVRHARGSEMAGRERDAFQVEAERHPKGGRVRSREEVYKDWLHQRLERYRVRLDAAKLKSFQRVRTVRRLRAHATEGPSALMQGTLTITDEAAFAELVARGVGRHRAYGYGMMLLRPAHRSVVVTI